MDIFIKVPEVKSHRKQLLFLSAIALLPSILLSVKGLGYRHDLAFHLQRIEGIAEGLKAGQFPVRMNSSFNDGYGYPVGIFYGDALLYLPAIFRIIGFTITTSYKLYVLIVNFLTSFITYWCFKRLMCQRAAFVSTFAYVTTSYRLVDIYVRGAVGEYTSFIFYPLIFLAIWNIYKKDCEDVTYSRNSILLACGMAGLIYTHILSTEMTVMVLVIVAALFFKRTIRKQTFRVLFKAVLLTMILGMSFIVPFFDYYFHTNINIKIDAANDIPLIQSCGAFITDYFAFFRSVSGGIPDTIKLRMQLTPGFLLIIALMMGIVLIIRKRETKEIKALVLLSLVVLLLASNIFPWDFLSEHSVLWRALAQIQFPFRFISFAVVILSVLLGKCSEILISTRFFSPRLYFIEAFIAFSFCCVFMSSSVENREDNYYYWDIAELSQYTSSGVDSGLNVGEYMLQGTDISKLDYGLICANAEAVICTENGLGMKLLVDAQKDASIEIPRFNYPNYVVMDESGIIYDIYTGENNKVKILIPNGYTGVLTVSYEEPWYWRVSEIISLVGGVTILGMVICEKRVRRRYTNACDTF